MLAQTTPAGRRYPFGPIFAQAVGYASLRYGTSGLERAFDRELSPAAASADPLTQGNALRDALGHPLRPVQPRGATVVTTLDVAVQRALFERLSAYPRAAGVVLDPRNGEILALASVPSFDPRSDRRRPLRRTSPPREQPVARPRDRRPLSAWLDVQGVHRVGRARQRRRLRLTDRFDDDGPLPVGDLRRARQRRGGDRAIKTWPAPSRSPATSTSRRSRCGSGSTAGSTTRRAGAWATRSTSRLPAAPDHLPARDTVTPSILAQLGFGQADLLVTPLRMALSRRRSPAAASNRGPASPVRRLTGAAKRTIATPGTLAQPDLGADRGRGPRPDDRRRRARDRDGRRAAGRHRSPARPGPRPTRREDRTHGSSRSRRQRRHEWPWRSSWRTPGTAASSPRRSRGACSRSRCGRSRSRTHRAALGRRMTDRTLNERYRLDDKLGEGGMAIVYAGTDAVLRRRVAIKVLRPQFAADADFVQRFYHEAESVARLSYPNIVNIYDVGREDETYFIVMELVDGSTLAEMIESDQRLPEAVAIDYAEQICRALAYAHRQGILHRDIKPANILITKDDVVKLSDFGIARAVTTQTMTMTLPGMVMGSVFYLSPEQAQGTRAARDQRPLQPRRRPLPDADRPSAVHGRVAGDGRAQTRLEPGPRDRPSATASRPALAAIVRKLLQKEPADRFQSATEVAARAARRARRAAVRRSPSRGRSRCGAWRRIRRRAARSRPTDRCGRPPRDAFVADDDYDEPEPSRRPAIAGLAVLLILSAIAGYYLTGRPGGLFGPPATVALPNVVGRSSADAERAAGRQRIALQHRHRRERDRAARPRARAAARRRRGRRLGHDGAVDGQQRLAERRHRRSARVLARRRGAVSAQREDDAEGRRGFQRRGARHAFSNSRRVRAACPCAAS